MSTTASAPHTRAGLASLFWTPDYQTGMSVIFDKLSQGCSENAEVLHAVEERIRLENQYATGLQAFPGKLGPTSSGFDRDEGATLRQAYVSFLDELSDQGHVHTEIASKLDRGIRGPFQSWSQEHKGRVMEAQANINAKIKEYNKKAAQTQKAQQLYFSKCRQLEDTDGVPRSQKEQSPTPPMNGEGIVSPGGSSVELAGRSYSPTALGELLKDILTEIPVGDYKVPIIGTYEHVSSGYEIALWARKRLNFKNVGIAEKFGQGLIDNGFLRPVGKVGQKKFVNSSSSYYQWQSKAMEYDPNAIVVEDYSTSSPISSSFSQSANGGGTGAAAGLLSPPSTAISGYLSGFLNHGKEASQIQEEISEADERYQESILELDLLRCELEQTISDTLAFMEQCELDRLKAIKKVLSDFSSIVSGSMNATVNNSKKLELIKDTVNPTSDLSYMIQNYKTGTYCPRVVVYENFHNASKCQTFGVDLPSVQFMVPTFLEYFKTQQEAPITAELWQEQVPLASIFQLRNQINNGQEFDASTILPSFPMPVVVSTLKEFLLELQDSVISFTMYDVFKSIYSTYYQKTSESEDNQRAMLNKRQEKLISSLRHLQRVHITTLESLINHFAELSPIEALCKHIAPYLLRPRTITPTTMNDKFPAWLIQDLIQYKDTIFPSVYRGLTSTNRDRSVSASEANRKANMEARNKELEAQSVAARAARNSRVGSPQSPGRSPSNQRSSNRISSNGLIPLTLSPSRMTENERHERRERSRERKRISSSSIISPPRREVSHHKKTNSTPVKSTIDNADYDPGNESSSSSTTTSRGRSSEPNQHETPLSDYGDFDDTNSNSNKSLTTEMINELEEDDQKTPTLPTEHDQQTPKLS